MAGRGMGRIGYEAIGILIATMMGYVAEGLIAGDFASKEIPSPSTMAATVFAVQLADRLLNALTEPAASESAQRLSTRDRTQVVTQAIMAIIGKSAIVAMPATLAFLASIDTKEKGNEAAGLDLPNFNANFFPFCVALALINGISTLGAVGLDRAGCNNKYARAALEVLLTVSSVFVAIAAGPGWLGGIPPEDAQRTLAVPFAMATLGAMVFFGIGAKLITDRCAGVRDNGGEAGVSLLSDGGGVVVNSSNI